MRAAAGTAGVSPALSAKREQRLLAFGSFAGETPAVPAAAHNGALRVRIAAAPVDGAANEELVRLLACTLRVPRSAVEITAGRSAKLKTVRVADLESSAIRNLFVPHGPKR